MKERVRRERERERASPIFFPIRRCSGEASLLLCLRCACVACRTILSCSCVECACTCSRFRVSSRQTKKRGCVSTIDCALRARQRRSGSSALRLKIFQIAAVGPALATSACCWSSASFSSKSAGITSSILAFHAPKEEVPSCPWRRGQTV